MKQHIIEIYDKGTHIGAAAIDFDDSNNALMAVYDIAYPTGEIVHILFVKDMDYGMVISKEIADKMREVYHE